MIKFKRRNWKYSSIAQGNTAERKQSWGNCNGVANARLALKCLSLSANIFILVKIDLLSKSSPNKSRLFLPRTPKRELQVALPWRATCADQYTGSCHRSAIYQNASASREADKLNERVKDPDIVSKSKSWRHLSASKLPPKRSSYCCRSRVKTRASVWLDLCCLFVCLSVCSLDICVGKSIVLDVSFPNSIPSREEASENNPALTLH